VADQGEERLFGGVGAQRKGIADLRAGTQFGEVGVDPAQGRVEEEARLVFADPLLKAFEAGVVGAGVEDGVADEPLDDEIEA
jgi:hypothetical protein